MALSTTGKIMQICWFIGHCTVVSSATTYILSWIRVQSGSRLREITYRLTFLGALVAYVIVLIRYWTVTSAKKRFGLKAVLTEENSQYTFLALVWLSLPSIPLAIIPFVVYSTFHCLSYTRTHVIPTLFTSSWDIGATHQIGVFIKTYYDAAMMIVSYAEVALWFNVLIPVLRLQRGSWMALCLYSAFLRARFDKSEYMQEANSLIAARLDSFFIDARAWSPQWMNRVYVALKGILSEIVDVTDLKTYAAASSPDLHGLDGSESSSSQDSNVEGPEQRPNMSSE